MKQQHETLILLEEKCRKMALVIKEKKKKKHEVKNEDDVTKLVEQRKINREELLRLETELKQAEHEKV